MAKDKDFGGLDSETARAFGFGRARANARLIKLHSGGGKPVGSDLCEDDTRCDAEWVEISGNGVITKSPGSTKPQT